MLSCETCRWTGCKNYGRKLSACHYYIMSAEEEKRISQLKKNSEQAGEVEESDA